MVSEEITNRVQSDKIDFDTFISIFWGIRSAQSANGVENRQLERRSKGRDRISTLPDELLVLILSLLPLREATATSILSRRWRYLWTFIPKLDFDGTGSLMELLFEEKPVLALSTKRWNYVRWVNHAIVLQNVSTVEELRVCFNLTCWYQEYIDKWLRYALSRKVRRLELNLTNHGSRKARSYAECYTFPYNILDKGETDFKYLEKISMHYVNVSGEALEFFLHSCPLLEHLSVSESGQLSTLKVIGPFRSLKHLEIIYCKNLISVEIRDANLVSFKYNGKMIHLLLKNLPLLVDIDIAGAIASFMENVLSLFSSYLPQLEKFTLHKYSMSSSWEQTEMLYSAVEMSNLKELVVRGLVVHDFSILPLANLLRASPYLQKFVVEASHWAPILVERKAKKIVTSYPYLKQIEFLGYYGVTNELELITHLLENAVALEKIVIDPRERSFMPLDYMYNRVDILKEKLRTDRTGSIRARAKRQLINIVPPKINLEIL